jgi:hypothetical protein
LLLGDEPVVTIVACASVIRSTSETFASPEATAHYCESALDIFEALKMCFGSQGKTRPSVH